MTKEEITISTWNVQTLRSAGKSGLLRKDIKNYRCDLRLVEVRWTGTGEINEREIIWSGEENEHARGLGFWPRKRDRYALISYKPINSRILNKCTNGGRHRGGNRI